MAINGFVTLKASQIVAKINEVATANGWNIRAEQAYPSVPNAGLFIYTGDNKIIGTYNYNTGDAGVFYNNGASSISLNNALISSGETDDIYFSSKGFLLKVKNSDATALFIVTINDDNTIIYGVANSSTGTTAYCMRYSDASYQSITYTANTANSTSLCNFVAKGTIGEDTSAQYAYFMPLYQYNVPGILTLNDEQYITNGYWCIKD